MYRAFMLSVATGSLVLSACASAPSASAAPEASASGASPSAAGSQDLLALGYKVEQRDGQALYCRSEVATGSIMQRKVCRSEDAARRIQLSEADRQKLNSGGGVVER